MAVTVTTATQSRPILRAWANPLIATGGRQRNC